MKTFFFILVLVFGFKAVNAVQPVRKPSILITIDGISLRSGDLLTVKPEQKFVVEVELEGGRRDYCNFPDTYADIAGKAQILSRGKDGISYLLNDKKNEWKLISEETTFSSENFLQINTRPDHKSAEVTVSNEKFPQTYLKISTIAKWQFNENGALSEEINKAEGTVYIQIAGQSDVWFKSVNVEAAGIRNDLVRDKLIEVQAACDTVQKNFFRLDFTAVQQSIRSLQATVAELKSTIDEVKTTNRSFQTTIQFIGLPSNRPYEAIGVVAEIKTSWTEFEPVLGELKQQLSELPAQFSKENDDKRTVIINNYLDWQNKLPKKTFEILTLFIPDLKQENIQLPANLYPTSQGESAEKYSQTMTDLKAFIDQRIQQIPDEIQQINSIHTRLQAIRLYDQMLRGYFSSIMWAQWKSTRGY